MLKSIILFVVCSFAVSRCFDCSGKANGIYKYTCFTYTECIGGSTGQIKCAPYEVFSPSDGLCVIPHTDSWPCPHLTSCKNLTDGHHPDVSNGCMIYYTCRSGHFEGHHYCPSRTVFDEAKQYCNWPAAVHKPCGTAHS